MVLSMLATDNGSTCEANVKIEQSELMAAQQDKKTNPLATFSVDYESGLPVWIQIKNRISFLITSGGYRAGDRLPTVRSLAVDLDISYNTVNRAYMDLERDGYIVTRRGRGTFVSESRGNGNDDRMVTVNMLVDELIKASHDAGIAPSELIGIVEARLEQN